MIEPTDDMVQAFFDALPGLNQTPDVRADVRVGLAAVLALVERDYLSVMADLVDTEPCWFDHHGGCQAHGYLSLEPGEKCPHAQAKDLLGLESTS